MRSKSLYSAPIVCVRTKDGMLRLCIHYHLLNQCTISDWHPILRIQDLTDSLVRYSWFSILDQAGVKMKGASGSDEIGTRGLTLMMRVIKTPRVKFE